MNQKTKAPRWNRHHPRTFSRETRQIVLILLLLSFSLLTCEAAAGKEYLLGRITVKLDGDGSQYIGPLRLRSDIGTVFQQYLRLVRIRESEISERIATLLSSHHLVVTKVDQANVTSLAQWEPVSTGEDDGSTQGHVVWLVDAAQKGPAAGVYKLMLREGRASAPLSVEDMDSKHLLVSHGERPVLRYNYGVVRQRADQPGPFDRACYIHPVWSPSGMIVTGDFSPEHIHQRGVYLAWRQARFGDVETDFWGLGDSNGRMLASGTPPQVLSGPVFTKLVLLNHGVIDDEVALNELVEVTVYAGEMLNGWLFDYKTAQAPPSNGLAMELPRIYYGGMSFRGPSGWLSKNAGDVKRALGRGVSFEGAQWLPPGAELDVLTSEGKDRTSGDRTAARWIDYTGPLGNSWGGLAIYDHTSSPRYATPLRIHPELPYFSIAFVQREAFTVHPESPLRLVYRIHVHDGHPVRETNERIAAAFNTRPQVTWQSL